MKDGEFSGAFKALALSTYAVVANLVELSLADCVTPEALEITASIFDLTKAVVASWFVFVPKVAVGPSGIPVNVGEAKGAFVASALST